MYCSVRSWMSCEEILSSLFRIKKTGGFFFKPANNSPNKLSSAVGGTLPSRIKRARSASSKARRASWFMNSPSLCWGICRPGVSINISWASGRVRIPSCCRRVVWGLGETAATVCLSTRFSRVDLPTLGRPITAINPDLCSTTILFPGKNGLQAKILLPRIP